MTEQATRAVSIVREAGEITQREFAKRAGVKTPAASRILGRLVDKGVFRRERKTGAGMKPGDKREWWYSIVG